MRQLKRGQAQDRPRAQARSREPAAVPGTRQVRTRLAEKQATTMPARPCERRHRRKNVQTHAVRRNSPMSSSRIHLGAPAALQRARRRPRHCCWRAASSVESHARSWTPCWTAARWWTWPNCRRRARKSSRHHARAIARDLWATPHAGQFLRPARWRSIAKSAKASAPRWKTPPARCRALIERDPDLAIFQVLRHGANVDTGLRCAALAADGASPAFLVASAWRGSRPSSGTRAFKVALTMNMSMLELQGQLARQEAPLSAEQRLALQRHTRCAACTCCNRPASPTPTGCAPCCSTTSRKTAAATRSGCTDVCELASLARRADVYTSQARGAQHARRDGRRRGRPPDVHAGPRPPDDGGAGEGVRHLPARLPTCAWLRANWPSWWRAANASPRPWWPA
jgi:hypothetical protein